MGGGSIASTAALETSIFTRLCLSVAGELPAVLPAQHGAKSFSNFRDNYACRTNTDPQSTEGIEGKVEEGRRVCSNLSTLREKRRQGKDGRGGEGRGGERMYCMPRRAFARFSLDDPSRARSSRTDPHQTRPGRITAHVDAEASGLLSLPAPVPATGRAASHTTRPTVPASEQFHRRGALAPAHSTPDAPTCSPTSQMHTLHWSCL